MKRPPKGVCPSCGKRGLGNLYYAAATQAHPARSYRQCQYCSGIKWLGLISKLEAAGFQARTVDGFASMEIERGNFSARATNRKGNGMPAEGDWALTSWDAADESEAITDIQDDDEDADIDAAISAILADLKIEVQQQEGKQ